MSRGLTRLRAVGGKEIRRAVGGKEDFDCCNALCCVVLYCVALCCIVLYSVLCCIVPPSPPTKTKTNTIFIYSYNTTIIIRIIIGILIAIIIFIITLKPAQDPTKTTLTDPCIFGPPSSVGFGPEECAKR